MKASNLLESVKYHIETYGDGEVRFNFSNKKDEVPYIPTHVYFNSIDNKDNSFDLGIQDYPF